MARNPARTSLTTGTTRRTSPIGFFGEVWSELRKVTWPTRQEATRLAMLVLAVGLVMGGFLGLIDMGFSRLISLLAGS